MNDCEPTDGQVLSGSYDAPDCVEIASKRGETWQRVIRFVSSCVGGRSYFGMKVPNTLTELTDDNLRLLRVFDAVVVGSGFAGAEM